MIQQNLEIRIKNIKNFLDKWKIPPELILLLIIVIFGFFLRIDGINFGLPQHFHPDETPLVLSGYQILTTGDLNPHFFAYPSFLIYTNSVIFGLYHLLSDSIFNYELYYLARLIVATLGTATIAVIYIIGKELFNNKIGFISAIIFTVLPLAVNDSHYATVDIPLTFFISLSFLFAYYITKRNSIIFFIACGICMGLATSTKYTGGLLGFSFLIAFILRLKFHLNINRNNFFKILFPNEFLKLILTFVVMVLSFFISSPYVLLDNKSSIKTILGDTNYITRGHGNLFINTSIGYIYHFKTSFYTGLTPIILILCILGICLLIISLFNPSHNVKNITAIILLFSWIIPYYLVIGSWEVKFARYTIPLLPFLSICTAYSILWINNKISFFMTFEKKRLITTHNNLFLGLLVVIIIISPLLSSFNVDTNLKTEDTRTASMQWIDSHIPYNSSIIWQIFSPEIYLLNKYYERSVFPEITEKDIQDKPDYLIFNSYSYGQNFYYPSEYGEYPQIKEINNSEQEYFNLINKKYTLIQEFYPSQIGDIHAYGVPITSINGSLTGPIIKIYKRKP
jgi:4-amino-4-deoxy-L-arabinose transferase-like glycosyltransferase